MNQQELEALLKDLQAFPKECEWVEFKVNNSKSSCVLEICFRRVHDQSKPKGAIWN